MFRLLSLICFGWLWLAPFLVYPQSAKQAYSTVSPQVFQQEIKRGKVFLLDVRTPAEFSQGHLPDAINLNFYDPAFNEKLKAYAKDRPVLVYCAVGGRSAKAAQYLQELKVPRVLNLAGGFKAWTAARLPVKN